MSDHQTKLRIFEAAEAIMLEKGFHAVGLNEILTAVNVPKGSFYHHFKSKEQFGVELLEHYMSDALAYKKQVLLSSVPEADPLQRLLTYMEMRVSKSCESEGRCPCLIVKLASEVSGFSDPMREVLVRGAQDSINIIADLLQEGLEKGSIAAHVDPQTSAEFILDLWTGATQRAATQRSTAPFRSAIHFIRSSLQNPPPSNSAR